MKTPAISALVLVGLIASACATVIDPSASPTESKSDSPLDIIVLPGDGTEGPTDTPRPVATPTLEATSTNISPSAQDFVALGNQAYYGGELQAARLYYAQALEMDESDVRALLGLGRVYYDEADYGQAWEAFTRAIALDPQSAEAYNWRGQVSYESGNRQQALVDFSMAIQVDPLFGLAYQNRALVQHELGYPDAAIVDLQVYLALAPDAADLQVVEELMARLIEQTLPFAADREGRLFADDFSDFTSGWINNPDPIGLASYNSGGYRIDVPVANRAIWGTNDFWTRDLRIEVDVRKIGGSDDNLIGVMCRFQDNNNFYVFIISSDGYYGVGKRTAGGPLEPTAAGQLQFGTEVRQGEALNHMSVECMGATLRLYVNNTLLIEVDDIDHAAGGVGLFGASFSSQGSDILFDNFEIYETPKH